MTRLAVIGAGFLGHALALGAASRGWSADVVGRSDPFGTGCADPGPGELRLLWGDGVERLPEVLDRNVDSVVVAAGGHFPVPSAAAPAADAIGTLSLVIGLCEVVRSLSPDTKVVLLSSAGAVYSPSDELRSESDPSEPTSPYGMSRRIGEEYLEYYRRVHGLSTHSLRCANIYGRLLPQSRGQGVVSAAFRSALTGTPFTLYGDGQQARDFIHLDDFVTATLDLLGLNRDIPRTLNVGTGAAHSITAVLEAVSAAIGSPIATTPGPSGSTDTGRLALDTSLLREFVDFEPLDLATGIRRMARSVTDGRSLSDLKHAVNSHQPVSK
ncbi:NAD-dependent epimerase/dehydratase family protein [Amycolatopsis cihanbeyliensis]|uniref:UDP-glucose 4-epimerase n=1 Tax=Amycolatopsis cihanbeyliensis TaxID=1128664 RepID=A0A542DEY2_AMYCI|nr:NAD-dependent epimerase/dehydratase family protein [Amycolatopsis cihanbeyliensis]TQJ01625.1 UDP-glucose 4-epimerase [Amycolatopsis cihanbeyliensis]